MENIEIEATNTTNRKVPLDFSEVVLYDALKKSAEEKVLELPKEVIISIAFVDKERIKELNGQYRKNNEETDVLSFCYERKHDTIVGEMLLCFDVIEKNAKEDKIEVEVELKKNIIHSLLHIFGFEHGDEMFTIQNSLVKKV